MEIYNWLPPEGVQILLVVFLSFLMGLEREQHKSSAESYSFGGVRTFPLIGLIGYATALLSKDQMAPVALGLAVVAAFLLLSYSHKVAVSGLGGVTSEMSGLATYLVGALVYREQYWIATTLTVVSMLLLELKVALEGLTKRIIPDEILTFTKFLLLTAVILPVLPDTNIGPAQINPFKTWLIVVAVSAVSYGSYVIDKFTKGKGGVVLAAALGGAYSSTVTTVVMAKRAAGESRPHLFAGGILVASGVMYLRLAALVALFNAQLRSILSVPFAVLAILAVAIGWFWSGRPDASAEGIQREFEPKNPLELRAAFFFALLFLAVLMATHFAIVYMGRAGVFTLAAIMGVTDVDPFIMGMTQSAGSATRLSVAGVSILIAAASNNLVKGIYAYTMADRDTGRQSLGLLIALAAAGLLPILWLPA